MHWLDVNQINKILAFMYGHYHASLCSKIKKNCFCSSATCGIIISPTRELAIQTHSVLQDLVSYHQNITSALVIGGENRWKQSDELSRGLYVLLRTLACITSYISKRKTNRLWNMLENCVTSRCPYCGINPWTFI